MKNSINAILEPYRDSLNAVRDSIELNLTTDVPLINDGAMHLFRQGGKMIRASMVMLSSSLWGSIPEGTVEIAAATEIVHAATLIHDDIIDKAFLRRGDVTVSENWGNKVGVLVGDFMYTQGLEIVVRDSNPDLFPVIVAGTRDMVQGELYQLQYSGINTVTEERYFRTIELKTARFIAACTCLGAIKAGQDRETRDRLFSFGLELGMAFQIVDDIIDITTDPDSAGKDTGNDFRDGKITLPFLAFMKEKPVESRKLFAEYNEKGDPDLWQVIRREIMATGAIESARGVAARYLEGALDKINDATNRESAETMKKLANFFVERTY